MHLSLSGSNGYDKVGTPTLVLLIDYTRMVLALTGILSM